MRHDGIDLNVCDVEPRFDLPPRLAGRAERRLAMRAATVWTQRRGNDGLPAIDSIDVGPDSEFATNAVLLDLRAGDAVAVISAGAAVAAMFGIGPGVLVADSGAGLAGRLLDACDMVRMTESAVPVEGALAGRDCPCLLTRGVVMPLADSDGRLGYAHAVLSWKEVLDPASSLALRREIAQAMARGAVPQNGAIDVFG